MGLTGMVFSVIAMAAGAVMYWAVTAQGHGFRLSTVGVILMIVGAVGLVASTIIFAMSRRPSGARRTYDREATNAQGVTTAVHEEVH
jgi:apolipoprotein N-acyltransferase